MTDRTLAVQQRWAALEAGRLLRPLDTRWRHVLGVVAQAGRVAVTLPSHERQWLVAAAYLHDVGYAPELVWTGSHALDGAVWLRARGRERLARLVAHHSGARVEAYFRGLRGTIKTFDCEESPTADALTYCDLTTDPSGATVTVEQRIADIEARYPLGHVVRAALMVSLPCLLEAVRRTEARIANVGLVSPTPGAGPGGGGGARSAAG